VIEFRGIHKSFGPKTVLAGVDLTIPDGVVQFLIGSSGAGKSVLIKHLIGLLKPDAGEIWLDGEDVSRLDERALFRVRKVCAMVFQHATLFDSMTCAENVALPLRLDQVHMRAFADRYPAELGDGMRKRVAIARALTVDPRYVLFDEPTTSLDPVSARRVDRLIRELSDRLGVTSIVVSHDLASIFSIGDRIAFLYKGNLRLVGTPDEFRASDDPIVRQFTGGLAEGPMEV
jgi:phospholipid/cholesterol/gamma-HCH transport system ATP-binding protein